MSSGSLVESGSTRIRLAGYSRFSRTTANQVYTVYLVNARQSLPVRLNGYFLHSQSGAVAARESKYATAPAPVGF